MVYHTNDGNEMFGVLSYMQNTKQPSNVLKFWNTDASVYSRPSTVKGQISSQKGKTIHGHVSCKKAKISSYLIEQEQKGKKSFDVISQLGGQGGHGSSTSISKQKTKQGPAVSVSNIRDITFYGCSEIILRTRNFTILTAYVTIFGKFTETFHFF